MLITIKTLFYWANAYENGFLNVFSIGNLLNSCALWQYHACAKERKHAVKMSTQKFSTQFTAKDIDFLYFSCVSCQKHIEMNIKWIWMVILVLISKPLNRSFDNTVSLSRPLVLTQLSPGLLGYGWDDRVPVDFGDLAQSSLSSVWDYLGMARSRVIQLSPHPAQSSPSSVQDYLGMAGMTGSQVILEI